MLNIIQAVVLVYFAIKRVREVPVSVGENTLLSLVDVIKEKGYQSVFIASSGTVSRRGMLDGFREKLEDANIRSFVFSDIVPDPTVENVEAGFAELKKHRCDCMVAVGGGSVLDCAKVISLRAANPRKTVAYLSLYIKCCKNGVPLFMVPTTSGTGSEITYFSVITDTKRMKKRAVISDRCIPEQIVLDYELLRHVPKMPTIYAGLDALTHTIEAYLSKYHIAFDRDLQSAPQVCRDVFTYLPHVAEHLDDKEARLKMAEAAYQAGVNFRKNSVGYIHAIAHRLGETYHIPHGLACAVVMPVVLEASYTGYGKQRLDRLARESGIAPDGMGLIQSIRSLSSSLGIPEGFDMIQESDYKQMIKRIQLEAILQGCPRLFSAKKIATMLDKIMI